MYEFHYTENALTCEGLALQDVAEQFGTPLYVYSKRSVIDHCRHLEGAFEGYEHLTFYAVKANSNVSLLKVIAGQGLGADVASLGELHLALAAGFMPEKITFSGVGKRDDEIVWALEAGIQAFNVESLEEMEVLNDIAGRLGKKARILPRINLDIEAGTHAYITTSIKQNKFGISQTQALHALKTALKMRNIEVWGIHSHLGSQIINVQTFMTAANRVLELVADLKKSGIPIRHIDFGGGFGVQYRGYIRHPFLPDEESMEENLSAANVVKVVVPLLRQSGCSISIQPGRSIMAHAGVLLSKVLYRKQGEEKVFLVVDGGMNDLIRPALYQAYHQIVPLQLNNGAPERVDVVGPLCETGDFFAQDRLMPPMNRGEYLAVMCTGAYGFVLSSNYNARPRAAEILVDGSTCTVIREREQIEQL